MSGAEREASVDELTLRIGRLELTVRQLPASSEEVDEGFVLVPAPVPDATSTEEEVLAATTAAELKELHLPFLNPLAARLTTRCEEWDGFSRVARAYRAGVGAKRHLAGGHKIWSPSISGLRNAYYIILASPAHPGGVWTKSYQVYSESVRALGGPKGSFAPSSSSHSFASLAEAEAYILGSGRPWPPQHQ